MAENVELHILIVAAGHIVLCRQIIVLLQS